MTSLKQLAVILCGGFLLALAVFQSERGVDHRFYLWWTNAALAADLEQLGAELPRSVRGVPFLHWQAGPGLLAVPVGLLARLFRAEAWSLHITGLLCAATFWWTYWHAQRLLTDSRRAWFGCLLSAVATPLGYYSLSISSEALALLPLGVLVLQTARGLRGESTSVLAVAAAAALLIAIRSYLGVYAWPAMYLAVRQASRRGPGPLTATLLLFAAAIALAVWQIGVVHDWMTGSPWRSPYQFGDADFSSWDPRSPHWRSILFDTFHGLFPTHPALVLAFAAVIIGIVRAPVAHGAATSMSSNEGQSSLSGGSSRDERLVWCITAIAIGVHIYIQGCWYYWWLAENSFGMRGLTMAAVPSMMALVCCLPSREIGADTDGKGLRVLNAGLSTLLVACALWSWLLWQQGPMDYLDWSRMMEGQWLRVQTWFAPELFAILGVSALLAGIPLTSWMSQKDLRIVLLVGGLATLIIAHLLERMTFLPPENLLVFYLALAAASLATWAFSWCSRKIRVDAAKLSTICVCGLLVFSTLAFANLWWRTAGTLTRRENGAVAFNVSDARQAYLTMSQAQRFANQREQLRGFLMRSQGEEYVLEADRMLQDGAVVRDLRVQGSRTRTTNLLKN